jgi:hypothetical protein
MDRTSLWIDVLRDVLYIRDDLIILRNKLSRPKRSGMNHSGTDRHDVDISF